MKYVLYLLIMLATIWSCDVTGSSAALQQNSAEVTTQGFVGALQVNDFELARQYCTQEAANALMDFETNLKMVNAEEKAALMSGFDMKDVSIACETIEGTTICKTCCGPDSLQGEWELIQQDQKWFIKTEIGI